MPVASGAVHPGRAVAVGPTAPRPGRPLTRLSSHGSEEVVLHSLLPSLLDPGEDAETTDAAQSRGASPGAWAHADAGGRPPTAALQALPTLG